MAEGYIPRSTIKEYGQNELELSGDELDMFISIIRQVDGDYISDANAKPTDPELKEEVPGGDAEGVKAVISKLAIDKTKPAHQKKPRRTSSR
jgi:hypothetical protein